MRAFGIFLSANKLFVFLCFARYTAPNFPYPSFLSTLNSSISPPDLLMLAAFFLILDIDVRLLIVGYYLVF